MRGLVVFEKRVRAACESGGGFVIWVMKYLLWLICGLCLFSCQGEKEIQERDNEIELLQRMTLTYLSYPDYIHEAFPQQLFDLPISMEEYDAQEGKLYFSIPAEMLGQTDFTKLCEDTSMIEFAVAEDSATFLRFGPFVFERKQKTFFSLPLALLKIDRKRRNT